MDAARLLLCPSGMAARRMLRRGKLSRAMAQTGERQEASHPHFVLETKEGQLFVPDLGTDKIHRLILEEKQGRLSFRCLGETELPAGSGPRHMAYHAGNGEYYLVTELGSELFRYTWDSRSEELICRQRQSLLTGAGSKKNLAADIRVFADGSGLLVSNRGENEIRVFQVDRSSGAMALSRRIRTAGWTRNVRTDRKGRWIFASNEAYEDNRERLEVFEADGNPGSGKIPLDGAYAMELFSEEG